MTQIIELKAIAVVFLEFGLKYVVANFRIK